MDTDATLERLINTDARRWAWLNDPEFHARVVVLVTAGTPTECWSIWCWTTSLSLLGCAPQNARRGLRD